MNTRKPLLVALLLIVTFSSSAYPYTDEQDVRQLVQRVFENLRTRDYGSLYDTLPNETQQRMSRDKFSELLQRTGDLYSLDRIEIGRIRVRGNLAVAETVMFGKVLRPEEAEGKIVAQQYLIREGGTWRIATGDRAVVRSFLAANPAFAREFPLRNPQVFVKRDGRWMDITTLLNQRSRRPT